jgi:hypothetical protein
MRKIVLQHNPSLSGHDRTDLARPLGADSVEKVSKMKLWNQDLKQSNPSKWSFESMLLVRRSP